MVGKWSWVMKVRQAQQSGVGIGIYLLPLLNSQGEGGGVEFQRRKRGETGTLERLAGLLAGPEKKNKISLAHGGGEMGRRGREIA